jgi:hypothetical protein
MKGIYLTTEAKQELEAQIVELEAKAEYYKSIDSRHRRGGALAQIFILQEILESATILPVEESWDIVNEKIETKNYTLAVSNEALKENDYALDLTEDMGLKYDVFIVDKATLKFANQECKKIIAYQPKGNAPELALPLLPEIVVEGEVEKLAIINEVYPEYYTEYNAFIKGYKAATKTYSEEDLRKAIELSRINYKEKTFGTVLPKYKPGEIVNLVTQAKT